MGNSNSAFSNHAEWTFTLDHERANQNIAIIAGHALRGKVIAKVHRTLPPAQLILKLTGRERTIVSGRSAMTHNKGERLLCSATAVLRQEGTFEIDPGTYVFPFEISLPSTLPSSMNGKNQKEASAAARGALISAWSIKYLLTVEAIQNGKLLAEAGKRFFYVASAPLPDELVQSIVSPQPFRVKSLGANRGALEIGARVIDVHVGRGTDLTIYLACKNYATASIYRVEVCLVEKMVWLAENGSTEDTQVIATLPNVDLSGILRGKQDKRLVQEYERRGGVQPDDLHHLHRQLMSEANKVILKVPFECRDTYKGSLVHISHVLKITMHTKNLVSNPSIEIPLQIGFPPRVRPGQQRSQPPPPVILPPLPPPSSMNASSDLLPRPVLPPAIAPQRSQPVTIPPRLAYAVANPSSQPSSLPWTLAPPEPLAVARLLEQTDLLSIRSLCDAIPFAEAVLVPLEGAIEAPMASAPPEAMVLGGVATYSDVESSIPAPPPARAPSVPTIAVLLEEMTFSINDFEIICHKLRDESWSDLLASIWPDGYGSILAHVNLDMDQPRVAAILANHLGSRFTCQFVKAAAQNAAEWNRATTLQRIIPYCVDITTNQHIVLDVLSDWERTVLRHDFERALEARGNPS